MPAMTLQVFQLSQRPLAGAKLAQIAGWKGPACECVQRLAVECAGGCKDVGRLHKVATSERGVTPSQASGLLDVAGREAELIADFDEAGFARQPEATAPLFAPQLQIGHF